MSFDIIVNGFSGMANWVWNLITFQEIWYKNYFYGLILISAGVWGLETIFPWRKNQKSIRRNFWLDGFYMFFNFFVFSILIQGFYNLIASISTIGIDYPETSWDFVPGKITISFIDINTWPIWLGLLFFFILNDFVQWLTHVLLHRFEFLWQFHKVHHSVKEMGFAAHLRYHWMENLFYKPLKTLFVMLLIGAEPADAFIVHFIALTIGHLNHANVRITWGPFKYLFNNSVMHLWHHVKSLPAERKHGVNFGISLSLWDFIFKTNYIPSDDKDIELGFEGDEKFPIDNIGKQLIYPIGKVD
jgi:sterol desaturase/sphingolipid hydroxylase (fatty acid hydroxylase superfamily)